MYSEPLLDHFRNPRNVGELAPPAVTVDVMNPACGDMMRLSIRWAEGRISQARYKTRGCTASIAAGSALTEWMTGRTVDELKQLKAADVEAAVGGLAPESKHAAMLCVDSVRAVLAAVAALE